MPLCREDIIMSEIVIDEERQKQAKNYARLIRRLMFLEFLFAGVYCLGWIVMGWTEGVRDVLYIYTTSEWLLVAGFLSIFGGIFYLLALPLAYYGGFVLPHRFGLSTQHFRGWISDQLKSLFLSALFGSIVVETIYALLRYDPMDWWLWIAILLLIFNVILANLAPILILPLFYKSKPLGDEYKELIDRLMNLAKLSGTRIRGIYQFDMSKRTRAANAALVGLGNTRRIILGDTLISEFNHDEIETVCAHELGHHVHKDIPLAILVQGTITLVGLYLTSLCLRRGIMFLGIENISDVTTMPLLFLVLGAYRLITMPLSNAYSRCRERLADQYALSISGKPHAYASALIRLANQNLAEIEPEPWVEFIFYSHPSLGKRIAMAQANRFNQDKKVDAT
jgi:STE24 endopeptidase